MPFVVHVLFPLPTFTFTKKGFRFVAHAISIDPRGDRHTRFSTPVTKSTLETRPVSHRWFLNYQFRDSRKACLSLGLAAYVGCPLVCWSGPWGRWYFSPTLVGAPSFHNWNCPR